jgi:iron complex transport system substrate-binding protein
MTKYAHPEESKGAVKAPAQAELSRLKRFVGSLIPISLVLLLTIFAACGDDDDDDTGDGEATGAAATSSAATPGEDERLAIPIFSCSADYPGSLPDATSFPVEVTDGIGRTVTIDAPPEKIASLSAGHTETLFAIGAAQQLGSVDNTSNCPAAAGDLPQIDAFNVSLEAITAESPDMVILFFDPGDLVATLESTLDVPVLMMPAPEDMAGVYEQIETLGAATGHASEAETLVTSMQERIEAVTGTSEADPPSVYHELDNTYYSVGPGSFLHDIYEIIGAENIAESTGSSFPQLSAEAIIDAGPDVIILADEGFGESPDTVKARAGWDAIPAVQDDRIYGIDPDLASRPGPRLAELAQIIAGYLYEDAAP